MISVREEKKQGTFRRDANSTGRRMSRSEGESERGVGLLVPHH